jgi:hypothetical protein
MSDNKRNLLYFESSSVRDLYCSLESWQEENKKRLLSLSIHKDGDKFCCIALTNPTEVVITDKNSYNYVNVSSSGSLQTVAY